MVVKKKKPPQGSSPWAVNVVLLGSESFFDEFKPGFFEGGVVHTLCFGACAIRSVEPQMGSIGVNLRPVSLRPEGTQPSVVGPVELPEYAVIR